MFKRYKRQNNKNYPDIYGRDDPYSRAATKALIISLIVSAIIGFVEIIFWFFSKNDLFFIEGFGNLAWLVPDTILLATVRLGARKADLKMHYGYQRIETLALLIFSLGIAAYILNFFFETLMSQSNELNPGYGMATIFLSLMIITMLFFLYRYLRDVGRRINSRLLLLNSVIIKADMACVAIILISGMFQVIAPSFDIIHTALTLFVALALFVYSSGEFIGAAKELIDANPSVNVMNLTEEITEEMPGVFFISEQRIRSFGGAISVDITIETDPEITVREAYSIACMIEERICSSVEDVIDVHVRVHPAGAYLAKETSEWNISG
ncbi:cation diffusion facilitator family transporter [Methanoplanus limicola]|uniref:Cation diffusion facilitator family transporter n=1 Tax=Methanoplanus limicola DSM 2279 TaxID=937775 RepID=H1Z2F7_9EURY|nr:cation transporter [Methanoplanus limicola]EHQ35483.1 cation diffusion facilitator family transporter [Methanoplanus limicola DSM 2279]